MGPWQSASTPDNEVTRRPLPADHFFPFAVTEGHVWFTSPGGDLAGLNVHTFEVEASLELRVNVGDATFDPANGSFWIAAVASVAEIGGPFLHVDLRQCTLRRSCPVDRRPVRVRVEGMPGAGPRRGLKMVRMATPEDGRALDQPSTPGRDGSAEPSTWGELTSPPLARSAGRKKRPAEPAESALSGSTHANSEHFP
jgi:hypothetical protein